MEPPPSTRQGAERPEVVVEQWATQGMTERVARRLISWPIGLVAGVLVGATALDRWGASPLQALLYGAVSAWLATRAREWLEGRVAAMLSTDAGEAAGGALALALDVAIGAGAGMLGAALGSAPTVEGIGTGAALAGLWSFVLGRWLCGPAADRVVDFLLTGNQSSGFALEPILADAEALEAQGRPDAAVAKYREVLQRRPTEPEAYIRAARLLRQQGRSVEAAGLLRQARARAKLTGGQQVLVGRELADLAAGPLGDPALAAAELAILAERFRGSPPGDAAERDLQQLRRKAPQN